MNRIRRLSDATAIGLSFLCTLHCLLLPVLLTLMPVAFATVMQDEIFHLLLVLTVIPLSIFALALGCKKHHQMHVLLLGFVGLIGLLTAVLVGHDRFGESGEKALTIVGSAFIALGHWLNFRYCNKVRDCHRQLDSNKKIT